MIVISLRIEEHPLFGQFIFDNFVLIFKLGVNSFSCLAIWIGGHIGYKVKKSFNGGESLEIVWPCAKKNI